MKVSDSGMPDEAYWNSLFDIPAIVGWLDPERIESPIVEFGCGYGTFTVPVAQKAKYPLSTFDIEPECIKRTGENAREAGLTNIVLIRGATCSKKGRDWRREAPAWSSFSIYCISTNGGKCSGKPPGY